VDDFRERLFSVEERVSRLEDDFDKRMELTIAVLRWRVRLVEVICYGFCAAVLTTFVSLLIAGVFGEHRTSPRLPLPTTPYQQRGTP
jgi:hypothetical protein